LLVVVGIIVVLIGLLVPALGLVRVRAQKTQSQALLNNLASNILAYQAQFAAFPGPMPAAVTTSGSATKVNGAQNLMLGLTYSFTQPPTPLSSITLPYPANASLRLKGGSADPSGPTNYAVIRPDGQPEQQSAYFSPTPAQVANDGGPNKVTATGLNDKMPMVIDNFPDPLPVLYFRRTPGVESPSVRHVGEAANTVGAYYLGENREILISQDLRSPTGTICSQQTSQLASSATSAADFEKLVKNSGGGSGTRGGFVLIAPGLDRIYGTTTAGVNDDITFVGGN
jgi:hypothetical protein